jgi:hypothetical protein
MVATMPVTVTAKRQPAIAEAALHEIAGGDVAMLLAHVPKPPEHQEHHRVHDDGVRNGEESHRTGAEGQAAGIAMNVYAV